jgi:arylsulfatase A-like enzyme
MLAANRATASALYDGEVAAADAGFGRFVAALKRHGLYDDSLIVFTADHGEQFLEHGGWRHESLWGEVLDVPLVVKLPAGMSSRSPVVTERIAQIDLLPTIADLVGAEVPREVEGQSLLPLLLPNHGRFVQRRIHSHVRKGYKEAWSVVDPPFKLVWRWFRSHREVHLFDLSRDAVEATNLADSRPAAREYLKALIARERLQRKEIWPQPKGTPTEELISKMKALGYVQ